MELEIYSYAKFRNMSFPDWKIERFETKSEPNDEVTTVHLQKALSTFEKCTSLGKAIAISALSLLVFPLLSSGYRQTATNFWNEFLLGKEIKVLGVYHFKYEKMEDLLYAKFEPVGHVEPVMQKSFCRFNYDSRISPAERIKLDDYISLYGYHDDKSPAIPLMRLNGMALLVDRFEKKHNVNATIFVTDSLHVLEDALEEFNEREEGSKITIIVNSVLHWTTVHCVRKNGKTYIATINAGGAGGSPIYRALKPESSLRKNLVHYQSVNRLQYSKNLCGIFALKVAQKISRESDFFGKLEKGELLLSLDEAKAHLAISKQISADKVEEREASLGKQTYFVLSPEYFALSQRSNHLEYYKKEFGTRKAIREYSHKTRRNEQVKLDDILTRKHRDETITKTEREHYFSEKSCVTNHNVLYFSNKYVNAMIDELKTKNIYDITKTCNRHILA